MHVWIDMHLHLRVVGRRMGARIVSGDPAGLARRGVVRIDPCLVQSLDDHDLALACVKRCQEGWRECVMDRVKTPIPEENIPW